MNNTTEEEEEEEEEKTDLGPPMPKFGWMIVNEDVPQTGICYNNETCACNLENKLIVDKLRGTEKQKDVSHRAAKLYRFNPDTYKKLLENGFNFEF